MAEDYRQIAESETDEGAPPVVDLFKALAKNPAAMFEGAEGAPRLSPTALARVENGTVTMWASTDANFGGIGFIMMATGAFSVVAWLNSLSGTTSITGIRIRRGNETTIGVSSSGTGDKTFNNIQCLMGDIYRFSITSTANMRSLRVQCSGEPFLIAPDYYGLNLEPVGMTFHD